MMSPRVGEGVLYGLRMDELERLCPGVLCLQMDGRMGSSMRNLKGHSLPGIHDRNHRE
jgi:hypothetical protein